MKKIYKILLIFISLMFVTSVKAAGTSRITISPSSRTYIVGNTFTVTVNVSATEPMAGLSYTIQYNSSVLSLESTTASTGGARNLDTFMNNTTTNVSYTYKFRAKTSGTSTISVTGAEVRNSNEALNVSTSTATIRVMTQAELEATYSSNNNLSSLNVDGYEIEPSFSQDVTEYNVTLKPETEMINVTATKADSTSSINGTGDIAVSEGLNIIKIEVVAQNGNIKTYTINVTVSEYDPINVLVDGVKYTVVRSKKVQTLSNNLFAETEIQIGEYAVPAFFNETTNTTLLALKNDVGDISYFIYKNGSYTKFNELKLGLVDLMVLDTTEVPQNYNETEIDINEVSYKVLKNKDISRFSLIYGTNLVNNNTGFYVYDNYENTLQRYDSTTIDEMNDEIARLTYITYILAGSSVLLFLLFILALILRPKKDKGQATEKIQEEVVVPEKITDTELFDYVDNIEKTRSKKKNIQNKEDVMEELDKVMDNNIDDIVKALSVTTNISGDEIIDKPKKKSKKKTSKKQVEIEEVLGADVEETGIEETKGEKSENAPEVKKNNSKKKKRK